MGKASVINYFTLSYNAYLIPVADLTFSREMVLSGI